MKQTILIADDEPDILRLVANSFTREGYEVQQACDGTLALQSALQAPPHLAVLDLQMPGLTGFEVIRALKADARTVSIPVILISAHDGEANRILGLELGADDFLRKPFSPRELVLRGRAILSRKEQCHVPVRQFHNGAIALDQDRCAALVNGQPVSLTAIEFKLLSTLVRQSGRMLARETLLTEIWGEDVAVDVRTVDTHVRRLRDKLGPAADQLVTVRGFGYRLDAGAD